MAKRQIDIEQAWPKKFVNWFYQEELTAEQETELNAWYDQATASQLELIDSFIQQLSQDTVNEAEAEAKGTGVFFNVPSS